jgi:hypothetical protein
VAVAKYLNYVIFANLLLACLSVNLLASDKLIENTIKPSIQKYFKKQKITFVYIGKTQRKNYFVIIRYKQTQDRVIVDKNGTILSISEDLNAMDGAEEGC